MMKINNASKTLCALIAMLLFLNPVIATAGAVFSSFSESYNLSSDSKSSSSMPCHDEMKAKSAVHQASNLNIQNPLTSQKSAITKTKKSSCCVDVCHCDDSGCHSMSLVFQFSTPFYFSALQVHTFNTPLYLSISSPPGSPPPIV